MFDNLIHDYHRFECFLYCMHHIHRKIITQTHTYIYTLVQTLLTEVKNICNWNATMKEVF